MKNREENVCIMDNDMLYNEAVDLLKGLIAIPSFSKEEQHTAALISDFLGGKNIPVQRHLNNIWCLNKYFDESKPTILLNSHHDTVRPNRCYTHDPFEALEQDGRLYGLGSNDAGGPLVSLLAAFVHFYNQVNLRCNLVMAATAEEEISGVNGIERWYLIGGLMEEPVMRRGKKAKTPFTKPSKIWNGSELFSFRKFPKHLARLR